MFKIFDPPSSLLLIALIFYKYNQLGAQIFLICLLFSLHVSGNYVHIIRRKYRTYATPGVCHSI